jgi:hypothetical protein
VLDGASRRDPSRVDLAVAAPDRVIRRVAEQAGVQRALVHGVAKWKCQSPGTVTATQRDREASHRLRINVRAQAVAPRLIGLKHALLGATRPTCEVAESVEAARDVCCTPECGCGVERTRALEWVPAR